MESCKVSLDMPSPSISYQYLYSDHDQYLDTNRSDSHSSVTTPYDVTFSGDVTSTSSFPSPESREADDGCDSTPEITVSGDTKANPKTAVKIKRESRYKNAPPAIVSRRRAQNRASQRAYRERKDQRIKDLEQMLNDTRAHHDLLSHAYADLQAQYVKLKSSPPSMARLDAQNGHPHSHQLSSSLTTSYSRLSGSNVPAELGGAFVDATSMAVLNSGNLESYLYPDVGSYAL